MFLPLGIPTEYFGTLTTTLAGSFLDRSTIYWDVHLVLDLAYNSQYLRGTYHQILFHIFTVFFRNVMDFFENSTIEQEFLFAIDLKKKKDVYYPSLQSHSSQFHPTSTPPSPSSTLPLSALSSPSHHGCLSSYYTTHTHSTTKCRDLHCECIAKIIVIDK